MRGMRIALAVMAAAGTAALLSGCGSSGSSNAITLYSGQHVQTTAALVQAFEKSTGITVNTRSDDEDTLAAQIVPEGSNSPADVFYTENSPALEYLQGKGLLAPVAPRRLPRPAKYSSPAGQLGRGVGPRERHRLQPERSSAGAAADAHDAARRPRLQGQARVRPVRDRLPADRHAVAARLWRRAAPSRGSRASANAEHRVYPDNETLVDEVNRGSAALGVDQPVLLVPDPRRDRRVHMHAKIAFFAPHDPGYVIDVSGAGVLKSSSHQADAQRFLAFLVSPPGPEIIAHSTATSTRRARASRRPAARSRWRPAAERDLDRRSR